MTTRKKAAILISGRGSNMTALIRAAAEADFPAEIACVISDQPEAAGLAVAASAGIGTYVAPRRGHPDKAAHEAEIERLLEQEGVQLICLAGFMRILSADFVTRWAGRLINIHPSLLPLFPGLTTHARVLQQGMRIHGCTVHFVTAEMDAGPIIAQAAVPVLPHDTEGDLATRVLNMEHKLYPLALSMVASGKARMEGGRTRYAPALEIGWGEHTNLMVPSSIEDIVNLEDLARRTP